MYLEIGEGYYEYLKRRENADNSKKQHDLQEGISRYSGESEDDSMQSMDYQNGFKIL